MQSKADLHVHTGYSLDSFSSIKNVVERAVKKNFKIIAVTDHETINGALKTREYVEKNNIDLQIIIGEEIYSLGGHIIALFLTQAIESHQPLEKTLQEIKRQGGMAIIPHLGFYAEEKKHKYFRFRVSYTELLNNPSMLKLIDGIEITNFTIFERNYPAKTRFINNKFFKKAEIGSSDAHIIHHIGKSYTLFPGKTIEDFKKAIKNRTTQAFIKPGLATTGDIIKNFAACVKIPFYFSKKWIWGYAKKTTRKIWKRCTQLTP